MAAAEFYYSQLTAEMETWCFEKWGLRSETLSRLRIGFAPVNPTALWRHLLEQGFDRQLLPKSGLFVKPRDRFVDFFQGRIIFPYWTALPLDNHGGEVVYFIGRQTPHTPKADYEQGKYKKLLTSSEKHPYVSETVSNRWFYGEWCLHEAKDNDLLLTEGVADVAVAIQAGIACLSPATTSFREEDWPRLVRLSKVAARIIIINDEEDNKSGERGAIKTSVHVFGHGLDARIGTLPRPEGVGKIDLADFLKANEANDLRTLMAQATPILDFHIQRVANAPSADKTKTATDVYPLIASLSGIERDRAEKALQSALGGQRTVSIGAIRDAIDAAAETSQEGDDTRKQLAYESTEYGLIWRKETRHGPIPVQLTNFDARIIANILEDDGAETSPTYELEARLNGSTVRFHVAADRFAVMNWPHEHLGPQAIVYAGFGLKDHARVAIQSLSETIAQRRIFKHSGWRQLDDGSWVYLHGGGGLGADGSRPDITVILPEGLKPLVLPGPPAGTALVTAIRASFRILDVAPDPITVPLLCGAYRAALGASDFSVHKSGPTGEGKTELAALIQQHWGSGFDARHLPASWLSTGNALEALAFAAKDSVLVVDDFAPGGNSADIARFHRDADRVLRAQGNRAGRGRLRPDATLKPPKPPRGLILSTGEDVPRGQSLRARLLILELSPGDLNWQRLTECQRDARSGLFAQAMAGFIQWLAPRYGRIQEELRQEIEELRRQAYESSQHRRTPEIMANLAVGMRYLLAFASEVAAITAEERETFRKRCWDALGVAAKTQTGHQETSEPTRRFLELIAAALASGLAHVAGPSGDEPPTPEAWGWRQRTAGTGTYARDEWHPMGERIGWLDDKDLYLEPDGSYALVQQIASKGGEPLGVSGQTLRKRLHQRDLLLTTDPTRETLTVRRTLQGAQQKVLHLSSQLLAVYPPKEPDKPDKLSLDPSDPSQMTGSEPRVSGFLSGFASDLKENPISENRNKFDGCSGRFAPGTTRCGLPSTCCSARSASQQADAADKPSGKQVCLRPCS